MKKILTFHTVLGNDLFSKESPHRSGKFTSSLLFSFITSTFYVLTLAQRTMPVHLYSQSVFLSHSFLFLFSRHVCSKYFYDKINSLKSHLLLTTKIIELTRDKFGENERTRFSFFLYITMEWKKRDWLLRMRTMMHREKMFFFDRYEDEEHIFTRLYSMEFEMK